MALLTWLFLMRRTKLPHAESIGCVSCLVGFVGGAVIGVICTGVATEECGLPILAVLASFGILGSIAGIVAGKFIALALFYWRPPSIEQTQTSAVSLADLRDKELLAKRELVEQLMSRAEQDGDDEVLMKLTAYRATLQSSPPEWGQP